MLSDNLGNVDLLEVIEGIWNFIPDYLPILRNGKNKRQPFTEIDVLKNELLKEKFKKSQCPTMHAIKKHVKENKIVAIGSTDKIVVMRLVPRKKLLYTI